MRGESQHNCREEFARRLQRTGKVPPGVPSAAIMGSAMRGNRRRRRTRSSRRGEISQPGASEQSQLRARRWIMRLWLASAAFGILTLADIALVYRFRQTIPLGRARVVVFSIVGLFICSELCAIAAVLTWISARMARR